MKDNDLRELVKMLSERVHWLYDEIEIMKKDHVEGCKCRLCKPRANPFIRTPCDPEMKRIIGDK